MFALQSTSTKIRIEGDYRVHLDYIAAVLIAIYDRVSCV